MRCSRAACGPHHYCLPVLKRERDRAALLEAATGDDPRFFLGTDSAPHARNTKETACGCAGIYSAHAGDRTLRGGLRAGRPARPAGGLRLGTRRGLLRPAAQRGRVSCSSAVPGRCRPPTPSAEDELVPLRAGKPRRLAAGRRSEHLRRRRRASPTASAASCPWSSTSRPAASTPRPTHCSRSPRC